MEGADLSNPEEVDALVEMWIATPTGALLWEIQWKWAKNQDWRHGTHWFNDMKKHYVQIMQWHLHMTISQEEEIQPAEDKTYE